MAAPDAPTAKWTYSWETALTPATPASPGLLIEDYFGAFTGMRTS